MNVPISAEARKLFAEQDLFDHTDPGPIRSPLRYPGGKVRVAKMLLELAPFHGEYREVFAGGAALFFQKEKSRVSWINDRHPGLYAFYVALRDHFDDLVALCLKQRGNLRKLFDYWANRRDLMEARDDKWIVERAVQFYFINRTVWGGRVVYDPQRKSRLYFSNPEGWLNLEKRLEHLALVSAKLRNVKLTCLSFEDCLADATPDTFIYCDPPYIRDTYCQPTDKLYDRSFNEEHHRLLAALLKDVSAKVMISYDNCPKARELYDDGRWRFVELEWKYCGRHAVSKEDKANGVKEKKVSGKELLILNY